MASRRSSLGMSQADLAEKVGYSVQTISAFENNQGCPSLSMIPKLADAVGISTADLLTRNENAISSKRSNPPISEVAVGKNFRIVRMVNGLSQAELAEIIGVSRGTIANLEAGFALPTLPMVEALASNMKLNLFDLLYKDLYVSEAAARPAVPAKAILQKKRKTKRKKIVLFFVVPFFVVATGAGVSTPIIMNSIRSAKRESSSSEKASEEPSFSEISSTGNDSFPNENESTGPLDSSPEVPSSDPISSESTPESSSDIGMESSSEVDPQSSMEDSLESSSDVSSEPPSESFPDDPMPTVSGYTYSISGEPGSKVAECIGIDETVTHFDLPETVYGATINSLDLSIFTGNTNLISVVLPSFVDEIIEQMFVGCSNLESVEAEGDIATIGERAFWGCDSFSSFDLPITVQTIGAEAFARCPSLLEFTMPDSVTQIGRALFADDLNLATVRLSHSITTLTDQLFVGCDALTFLDIPEGVTSIVDRAFDNCDALSSIVIPSTIQTITYPAFPNSYALAKAFCKCEKSFWDGLMSAYPDEGWDYLPRATAYYYSETAPIGEGHYWHYANGLPTIWGE